MESSVLNSRDLTRRDTGGSFVDVLDDIGETPEPLRRAWSADTRTEDKAQVSSDDEAVVVADSEAGSASSDAVAQDNLFGVQDDGSVVEAGETVVDDQLVPTFGIADALAQMSQLPQVTGTPSSGEAPDEPDVSFVALRGSPSSVEVDSASGPAPGNSTPETDPVLPANADAIVSSNDETVPQAEVGAEVSTNAQQLSPAAAVVGDDPEVDLIVKGDVVPLGSTETDEAVQLLATDTSESSSAATGEQAETGDEPPTLKDGKSQVTADDPSGSGPSGSVLRTDDSSSPRSTSFSSGDGSSVSTESSAPAVNVNSVEGGTRPTSAAPATALGGAPDTVVVNRILDTIEVMSRQPPPRTLTLDLTDMHGVRVTLSITSTGVSLVVADTGAGDANTQQWEQQLDQLLSNRGFGSDDRSGNRPDRDTRSDPESVEPRRPMLRAPVARSTELRL